MDSAEKEENVNVCVLKDALQVSAVPMVTRPKNVETNSITLSFEFCSPLSLISILCLPVSLSQSVQLPPVLSLALEVIRSRLRKEVIAFKCHKIYALNEREH